VVAPLCFLNSISQRQKRIPSHPETVRDRQFAVAIIRQAFRMARFRPTSCCPPFKKVLRSRLLPRSGVRDLRPTQFQDSSFTSSFFLRHPISSFPHLLWNQGPAFFPPPVTRFSLFFSLEAHPAPAFDRSANSLILFYVKILGLPLFPSALLVRTWI